MCNGFWWFDPCSLLVSIDCSCFLLYKLLCRFLSSPGVLWGGNFGGFYLSATSWACGLLGLPTGGYLRWFAAVYLEAFFGLV